MLLPVAMQNSETMLLSVLVFSFEDCTILPNISAVSIVLSLLEFSLILIPI